MTRPVVYLGPSAPLEDVRRILPRACVRPPIRRGDLYRDRILKFGVFVIVDGVFEQELAVSPREVVDVLRDGAFVVGASSMGALRAADCWPAGAVGIGQIFRLFRQRAIGSEDEVAVAFHLERPFPSLSESLINMRFALRRAVRCGLLAPCDAARFIEIAARLGRGKRTWRRVFDEPRAPALDSKAARFLTEIDVKRDDARRAFRYIADRLDVDPGFGSRLRPEANVFGLLGEGRERSADPLGGAPADEIRADFARWALLSGRAGRWMRGEVHPLEILARAVEPCGGDGRTPDRGDEASGHEPADGGTEFAQALWRALEDSDELDAALFRFQAFCRGAEEAERRGLKAAPADLRLAEDEIAQAHRFHSWQDLVDAVAGQPVLRCELQELRRTLARNKHLRRLLFCASSGEERTKPRGPQ